ncbi:1-acyl-Sn-glycerol-3-phosphate acyltransferase [Vairimorpha necatrix]|uniref:1-acyl-Sn-glycerol-3-phosphate acyltransferase n=1 Tax=Vairimorpha necatrix TaxID=6039 RepID=A0AAX4JG92_9MICR
MIHILAAKIFCFLLILLLFTVCVFYIPIGYLISLVSVKWSIKITSVFSYCLWEICGWIFNMTYTVIEEPNKDTDETNKSNIIDKYLIISNHQAALDFMILNHLFPSHGTLKYLIKSQTKYYPIFYQIINLLKFIIVSRDYNKDKHNIKNIINLLLNNKIKNSIVIFPEGTRMNNINLKRSREYIANKNRNNQNILLNNVLYPRHKGFELIHEILVKHKYKIADLTFHNMNKMKLWEIFFTSKKGIIKYDLRIVDIEDVREPKEWLEESFIRKDRIIENMKRGN